MAQIHSTLLLATTLLGCGELPNNSSDENNAPGKNALAASGENAVEEAGDEDLLAEIDGAPFEPDTIDAFFYPGDDPVWVLTAKEGSTWIYVENYPRFGGATGAETRTLGSNEVDYSTCGVCVLLKTDCAPHGDHSHCGATYMPVPGSYVTFDTLDYGAGGNWAGTLSPIRFVEVSMDSSTYETTPIEGGDQIEIGTWSFEVVLEAD